MNITKDQIINEVLQVKQLLIQFLRNPIQQIKNTPDWPWPKIIAVQVAFTAICGLLSGLLEERIFFSMIVGMLTMPIITFVTMAVSTLFFYYCFQIFAEKTVSLRALFTLVLFANFPHFIFQIVSAYLPPIILVGMAFSALLLIVGFIDKFQIEKRLVVRLIVALYGIFFSIWIVGKINSSNIDSQWGSSQRIEAPEVQLGE